MKKITVSIIAIAIILSSIVIFLLIDADNDGLTTFSELKAGTEIFKSDSDSDGLSDGEEINDYGTDALNSDCDNDDILDGDEINTYSTDPHKSDSDSDGLDDNDEISVYHTDPNDPDYDDDGLSDGDEITAGTEIKNSDTDGDGVKDGYDSSPLTHNWKLLDSDDDGWDDYKEYYEEGTDRFDSDTDGDGAPDGYDAHPLSTAKKTKKTYEWYYPSDRRWTWEIYVSYDLYMYESQLDRIYTWSKWGDYTLDPTAKQLASGLKESAEEQGYTYYQTVDFILAFVQSLPYTQDSVTTEADEYPRYPLETLYEDGGDCEDTSILFASILREMKYDNCLTLLPGHAMVSVYGDSDYPGSYFTKNGKKYYCCETTSSGYKMGTMPTSHAGESATLYNVGVTNPVTPPNPQPRTSVVDYHSIDTYEGFDRVGYVYVVIKNNGDPGYNDVSVTVTQGENQWTKSESAYLNSYQSTILSFRFSEIELWTSESWSYSIKT